MLLAAMRERVTATRQLSRFAVSGSPEDGVPEREHRCRDQDSRQICVSFHDPAQSSEVVGVVGIRARRGEETA